MCLSFTHALVGKGFALVFSPKYILDNIMLSCSCFLLSVSYTSLSCLLVINYTFLSKNKPYVIYWLEMRHIRASFLEIHQSFESNSFLLFLLLVSSLCSCQLTGPWGAWTNTYAYKAKINGDGAGLGEPLRLGLAHNVQITIRRRKKV